MRRTIIRLQKSARIRADEEARQIPWQRLQETRNQYVGWQEFCFWAGSILEIEKIFPIVWALFCKLAARGFLGKDRALSSKVSQRAAACSSPGRMD